MYVLVSGATGFIGTNLIPVLSNSGHGVVRLVRQEPKHYQDEIFWNPVKGILNEKDLHAVEAVVHLAGENISGFRWTERKKSRIRNSRIDGTRLLCEKLASIEDPPKVFINASAVGYYGDRSEDLIDEWSQPGDSFLSQVCREWEEIAEETNHPSTRVVHLRMGIVLSRTGGVLKKMLIPFKLGLGGKIGAGVQFMSWIAMPDLIKIILRLLTDSTFTGPVNAVSPNPVTNYEWTQTLASLLHRRTLMPVPAWAARFALGEMADELLLASQRVIPSKLQKANFEFTYPSLEEALENTLLEKKNETK